MKAMPIFPSKTNLAGPQRAHAAPFSAAQCKGVQPSSSGAFNSCEDLSEDRITSCDSMFEDFFMSTKGIEKPKARRYVV